jgi:multimeric flavodoxin WrbA
MTIAVIYGGTRPNGNTEYLASKAIGELKTEKIFLRDYTILPIIDYRHSPEGFPPVDDEYDSVIEQILPHDTWVFVTPIYWYSMSGTMKNFIDRWSQTMRDQRYPGFRSQLADKRAFVIAAGGDQPKIKGLPMILQFQHIFNFFGTTFEGYVIGKASRPGDMVNDLAALSAATDLSKVLERYQ